MAEEKKEPKIIGNKSEGHKYHYASLADIARAGITIPPMRVATLRDGDHNPIIINGKVSQYIEAFIDNQWIQGCEIVIPASNQMNDAQAYGAALTYARRYRAEKAMNDLKELYVKAGNNAENFDKWIKENAPGGMTNQIYGALKADCIRAITDKAEKEKKA